MPQAPTEVAVATLQVQLELERAHRTEDRLRWALSDAQLLMTTLLQIISTLRGIVTDLDTKHFRELRNSADTATIDVTANQRLRALEHKATAEDQLARVNERRALLETLWEQAQNNVHRLSLHPDVTEVKTLPAGPALPQQELLSTAILTQPALTDIATALGKAQEINNTEESKAYELQQNLKSDTHPQPIDELATLLAATQLTDAANREMALRTLIRNWPQNPKTRDALVRLTVDDQPDIRAITALNLARTWPDDTASREALIAVTRDRELRVQTIAVWGLVRAWAGDADALDALASLTQDHSEETREIAVEGLAEGWPGNDSARDALLPLVQDAVQHVREVSIEMLLQSWPGDVTTRDTLLRLLRANDAGVREVAVNGLSNGWPSDASVADALLAMLADPVPTVRWAAEQGLALRGKAAAKSRMGFTGSELLVEVGDHRNAHRAHPGQEANSNDYGPLIAARVPHDFYIGKRLSTNRTLCRGIKFNPGINIVFGENGTGKTLFLKALAIQTGAIEGSRLRQLTNHFPWARDLAEHLDILWGENLTPEDCFYLGPKELDNRSRQNELEKVLAAPPTYRLYLLDDPTSSREFGATSRIYRKMNQFSQQGCQVIIVTSDFKRLRPIVPTDAKVIRLGSRRLRDRMTALGW